MKELDLLKKDWQKSEASFEQLSEKDIYAMIHKKSSSVVKWILIVSILEFVILNGIGLLLSDDRMKAININHPYLHIVDITNYIVITSFIFLFYKNYKTISSLDSSKKLLTGILRTRKIVTYYIFWNIIIGGILGVYTGVASFNDGYNSANPLHYKKVLEEDNFLAIGFIMIVTMLVIWLFYKLLYGNFLKKLKDNYEELRKIES
jgi:hypothetical protein